MLTNSQKGPKSMTCKTNQVLTTEENLPSIKEQYTSYCESIFFSKHKKNFFQKVTHKFLLFYFLLNVLVT